MIHDEKENKEDYDDKEDEENRLYEFSHGGTIFDLNIVYDYEDIDVNLECKPPSDEIVID